MLKLLLALSFVIVTSAFAATVEDPQGLLKTLDASRTKPEFADAFRMADHVSIRILNKDCVWGCDPNFGCGSVCTPVTDIYEKNIVEVTADNATASSTDGSSEIYDRTEFDSLGKGFLMKSLTGLDVTFGMAGKVVLRSLAPTDFVLLDNSKVAAFDLKGVFVTGKNEIEFSFTVAKNVPAIPGMAEILYATLGGLHDDGVTKLYKIKAISRK